MVDRIIIVFVGDIFLRTIDGIKECDIISIYFYYNMPVINQKREKREKSGGFY